MISKTIKRYSSVLGLVLVICLVLQIFSTGILILRNQPLGSSPSTENVDTCSLDQILFYWANNLGVGLKRFFIPTFFLPFTPSNVYSDSLDKAQSNFENRWVYGQNEVWGFLAAMKIHGTIELTGILLMAIAGILFWFLVFVSILTFRNKASRFELRLVKMKKKLKKEGDLLTLLTIGIILVFVAGPIEACISWPILFPAFATHSILSITYLVSLCIFLVWLFFIKLEGYAQIRKSLKMFHVFIKTQRKKRNH